MNRLTHKTSVEGVYNPNSIEYFNVDITDKLGKLEDIMEKYGIESVESLKELLQCLNAYFINSASSFKTKFGKLEKDIKYFANRNGKHYEKLCEMTTNRDAWKKACELACKTLARKGYDYPADYFYQQAQKRVANKLLLNSGGS